MGGRGGPDKDAATPAEVKPPVETKAPAVPDIKAADTPGPEPEKKKSRTEARAESLENYRKATEGYRSGGEEGLRKAIENLDDKQLTSLARRVAGNTPVGKWKRDRLVDFITERTAKGLNQGKVFRNYRG